MAINQIPSESSKLYPIVIAADSAADRTDLTGAVGFYLTGPFPPGVYKFGNQESRGNTNESQTLPQYIQWGTVNVPENWTTSEYANLYRGNGKYTTFYLASTLTSLTAWYAAGAYKRMGGTDASSNELSYQDGKFWLAGANNISSSTDGITWTTTTVTGFSSAQQRLVFGSGETEKYLLVGIGGGSSTYYSSTNGTTWTTRTFPVVWTWFDTQHFNGVYYTAGYDNSSAATRIYSSTDGITWTARYSPATTVSFYRLAYGPGKTRPYVASGGNAGAVRLVSSTDGITWSSAGITNPIGSGSIYSLIYDSGSGNYYAWTYLSGSPTYVLTSTDGIAWTTTGSGYTNLIALFQKTTTNEYYYFNGNNNSSYLTTSLTSFTNQRLPMTPAYSTYDFFQNVVTYFDNGTFKYWTGGNGANGSATITGGAPNVNSDPLIIEKIARNVIIA